MRKKLLFLLLSVLLVLSLAACAEKNVTADSGTSQPVEQGGGTETETSATDQLTVRFGDNGTHCSPCRQR